MITVNINISIKINTTAVRQLILYHVSKLSRRDRDIGVTYRDKTEMFEKTPRDRLETETFETETTTLIILIAC